MKKWIAAAALMIGVAHAQQMPYLVGSVNNRANGQIQFTSSQTNCGDKYFVYIKGDGGRLEGRGCYVFGNQFIVVTWENGDTYTYDYEMLQLTPEMLAFMESKK